MDCEKFENLLIDELYGELDEVTSAAVRRHAAGCARCSALLSGLRATRKVAALPMVEPSEDLEDRILSAVREQQKVLPFRARASTVLSRAGAWAMRPQTAMAAVFLLVIGTSFVLVQNRPDKAMHANATNAEGAPMSLSKNAASPAASAIAMDDAKESAFAHGVEEKHDLAKQRMPTTIATAMPDEQLGNLKDSDKKNESEREIAANRLEAPTNAGPVGGTTRGYGVGDLSAATTTNGAGGGHAGLQQQAAQSPGGVNFGSAKAAFDHGQFEDARTQFDQLSPNDPNATFWAGKAEKAKNGCSARALQYFDSASQRAGGTPTGDQATLEAARCYSAQSNPALARQRYSTLVGRGGQIAVTAQSELDAMAPAAARKASAHAPATVPQATTTAAPTQKAATDSSL